MNTNDTVYITAGLRAGLTATIVGPWRVDNTNGDVEVLVRVSVEGRNKLVWKNVNNLRPTPPTRYTEYDSDPRQSPTLVTPGNEVAAISAALDEDDDKDDDAPIHVLQVGDVLRGKSGTVYHVALVSDSEAQLISLTDPGMSAQSTRFHIDEAPVVEDGAVWFGNRKFTYAGVFGGTLAL